MSLWSESTGTVSEAIAACIQPIVDAARAAGDGGSSDVYWVVETDYESYVSITFKPAK